MVITKKFYFYSLVIFVVLMGFLAIGNLDYTISKSLINQSSLFANIFNMFGEIPAFLGMLLALVLLYGGRRKDVLSLNIIISLLCIPLIFAFSYALIAVPINYAYEHSISGTPSFLKILSIVLSIVLAIALIYISEKKGEEFKKYRKHAWLLLVLIFSEIFAVNIIKCIWARPRMRSITNISQFKHWYEISGWTNDNELKSFPSGHAANAFVGLAYTIFIPYLKSIKIKTYLIIAITWGVLVSLSRVIIGAHFLSDVLVASYITIYLFIFWEKVFFKHTK